MRVLVADDEAVSRRLLQSSLTRWGYEVVVAEDGDQASRILLSADAPKLAVLDWMMPGMDGAQLCREIRRSKPEPYTYIVMLTVKRKQDDVIQGLESGADDYVRKPFDPGELKVRLRTGKRILYLQDQLINAREALRDQATRDHLTGLWNRPTILDILGNELSRADREGSSLGIALVDLDAFKCINDVHGHAGGDEVLRVVSRTMSATTRRYDSIGRYGGEEFLVVFPGCDETNAVSHAERLRHAIAEAPLSGPIAAIHPTISVGVAISGPRSNRNVVQLIQAADFALYRAKRSGRNRVEVGRLDESEPPHSATLATAGAAR
jgi:diguanylate cyclase (GGDEF)-like protein